jgi:3,4-dihydroxy 2-butanone 4-phosphate synthase/GTP cyclohydrolase II
MGTAMQLAEWLEKTGTKKSAFARQIGVRPSAVTGYCNGDYAPRATKLAKIEVVTGGAVRARDFPNREAAE